MGGDCNRPRDAPLREAVQVSSLVEVHMVGGRARCHASPLLQSAPAAAQIGLGVARQPSVNVGGLGRSDDEVLGEGGVIGDRVDCRELRRLVLLRDTRVVCKQQACARSWLSRHLRERIRAADSVRRLRGSNAAESRGCALCSCALASPHTHQSRCRCPRACGQTAPSASRSPGPLLGSAHSLGRAPPTQATLPVRGSSAPPLKCGQGAGRDWWARRLCVPVCVVGSIRAAAYGARRRRWSCSGRRGAHPPIDQTP